MRVFLSYRRTDSGRQVDELETALRARLAGVEIFRDVASIESGERWREKIDATIANSDIMLVAIGPSWLDSARGGLPRLHADDDVVRQEIAHGLRREMPMIPVLFDDAPFPGVDDLPGGLAGLTEINAHRVGRKNADRDTNRLIQRIGRILNVRVQEQASRAGRAAAQEALSRVWQLIDRDPKARDFEAFWRWLLEAKPLLLAEATGTEVRAELDRLEELFTDARDSDEVGRELTMLEATATLQKLREWFATDEERARDESARPRGGAQLLPGVSTFNPTGSWELEMEEAGTSGLMTFSIDKRGMVKGKLPWQGTTRDFDGVHQLRGWRPPEEEAKYWVGEPPFRVVGLVLEIKSRGMPEFAFDIPIDEEFGDGFRGRDGSGKTFYLQRR